MALTDKEAMAFWEGLADRGYLSALRLKPQVQSMDWGADFEALNGLYAMIAANCYSSCFIRICRAYTVVTSPCNNKPVSLVWKMRVCSDQFLLFVCLYHGLGLLQAATLNESSVIDSTTIVSSLPPSTRRPKSVPAHLHSTPDTVRSWKFFLVFFCASSFTSL